MKYLGKDVGGVEVCINIHAIAYIRLIGDRTDVFFVGGGQAIYLPGSAFGTLLALLDKVKQ